MCGLVGIITNEKGKGAIERKKLFEELLFADTLRGPHGTGVFVTEHGSEKKYLAEVYKKAMHAPDFLQLKAAKNLIDFPATMSCMIGHNRWATSGGVSDATSHPFQHGNITMVHNGTLNYHDNLKDGKNFAVDSEAICYSISEEGIEETAKKLDGAFALIWHDATDGTLNILRNNERPLSFVKLKKQDTWVIASEGMMLRWILDRNKVEAEKIYHINEGAWIKFDLANPTTYTHEIIEMSTDVDDLWWGNSYSSYGKKNKSADAILKERLGLKKGDFITGKINVLGAEYHGNRAIDGTVVGDSSVDVTSYQVPAEKAEALNGKTVKGKIVSVYKTYQGGSEFITAVMDKSTLEEVEEGENEIKIVKYEPEDLDLPDLNLDLEGDFGIIRGPNDREMTQKEYEDATKFGCSFCQCDLPIEHHEDTVWVDSWALCQGCNDHWTQDTKEVSQ